MKTLTRITAIAGAALLFALAGQAGAEDDELTADQVKAKIEAAGFKDVTDIHREGDHFDAKATKNGEKVDLEIDARTGSITAEYE